MEFLRSKSVIALVVMILGVSYISATENVTVHSTAQNNGQNVRENA
jgi:hypothetical protein